MQTAGLQGAHLSFQQAHLWKWLQKSQSYRVQYALKIEGVLDTEVFQQALQLIVDRHEILHTTFYCLPGMEIPMQVVSGHSRLSCSTISLEMLSDVNQMAALEEQFACLQQRPFDLEHGPLLHVVLLRLAEQTHVLLLSLHALCGDASTLNMFTSELQQTYVSCLLGEQQVDDEEEEPLQYIDVSTWQNTLRQSDSTQEQREFWQTIDLSSLSTMRLPFEQGERNQHLFAQQAFIPQQLVITLQPEEQSRIQSLSQRLGVSVSTIMLACWQVLLWRLTDELPLLGLTCDGRPYEELAEVVGPYGRMVPLNLPLTDQHSFTWVLEQAHQALQEASERQLYFSWDSSQSPQFFPVSFTYETWPQACSTSTSHGLLSFSVLHHSSYTEPFLLQLHVAQLDSELELRIEYQDGVLSVAQAYQLARSFQVLLQEALAQPHTPIGLLPLLAAAEQEHLQQTWMGPKIDWPFQPLHRFFEAQAVQHAQQPAIVCGQEELSYQQLNEQANQLAHLLRRHGIGSNVPVGLCLPRSLEYLVAMLAVLKAGGAYVSLDPDMPPARLERLLQEIAAPVVITQQPLVSRLDSVKSHFVCLETMASQLASEPTSNLPEASGPQDLAYVIYTSGSTGQPKGVMIQQQSVSNYTYSLCDLLAAEPGWHFACVSSLAADLGNTVIFCSLASGGCLHLLPYEMVTDGLAFSRYVREHPIDVLKIVPSHLQALLSSEGRDMLPGRFLILGGEALPWSLLERLRTLQADCQVINHYGPTEATIGALVNVLGKVSQEQNLIPQEQSGSVPIGRPLPNTQAYVLDRHQQWVAPGTIGELYLGGVGLAAGYLHRPEHTQERFVTPMWKGDQAPPRLYRTGDLVRARTDGKIEFVGRADTQVKLRGFRIELGEIEVALRHHPGVREAVVEMYQEPGGEPQLVGYLVAWQLPGPSSDDLHGLLQAYLPSYMIPNAFVLLDRLPLTTNGKIDRRRLPAPSKQESFHLRNVVAPRTPVEELLVGVWESLLGVSPIGIEENFFRLGGHSLMGTQMISRIRGLFGLEVPIGWLFESPTVEELAMRLEREQRQLASAVEIPPLVAASRQQELPLSFAQQRLWFLDQLEPSSSAYNIPIAVEIDGLLDLPALISSVREVMRRHEILRSSFPTQDGEPYQVVGPVCESSLVLIDLQAISTDSHEQVVKQLAQQEAQQPFDLACGPLLRVHVLRLQPQSHVGLLTLHHIVSDGWSSGILMGELSRLYVAYHKEQSSLLAELPLQYADYALWQRQWLQGEVLASQVRYWTQQLAGITPLELPTDYPRPAIQTLHGAQQTLILSADLSQQLKSLSQQEGVTLFMTLLAAFQVLLSRYSGQSDIAVGTPVANRTRAEIEGLIGFFVNTLVLRSDLSDKPSFRQLLVQVRENALQAYAHQDVPFEQVVEALQPERDRSRSPLFQVLFMLQNAPRLSGEEDHFTGVTFSPLELEQTTAKFDLTLSVTETQEGLRCSVEYNTDLFAASSVQRLLNHWQVLLQGIVAQPEQAVTRLPFLAEEERQTLLIDWNATESSYPTEACFHTLFEAQVKRHPQAIALVFQEQHLTYRELNRRANQLARRLRSMGVSPEVAVGICMERGPELLIGLLGIQKAGGAYVPLDPSYPQDRLAFILADVQAPLVLAQYHIRSVLASFQGQVLCLDRDWPSIAEERGTNLKKAAQSHNSAYIIHTSGSTGVPKGVVVEQGNLVNFLHAMQRDLRMVAKDSLCAVTSISFDIAGLELYLPLLRGARLGIVNRQTAADGRILAETIAQWRPSVMQATPATWNMLLAAEWQGDQHLQILCGGEALPEELARTLSRYGRTLWNMYGPTETTIWSTSAHISSAEEQITIGHPIANTQIYLLDTSMQPVAIGGVGDLYIGGHGLARGYHKRPDLTAERFVPDPFSLIPGARLYYTGDKARYLADGRIEYLGRVDQQVKLRGFRIELGEIETLLDQHPQIRQSIVVVREGVPGDKHLVAYLIDKHAQETPSGHELRQYLRGKLPDYMIPSLFVTMEAFPLTPNGKVDRRLLSSMSQSQTEIAFIGPRDELEYRLRSIWEELLGVSPISVMDSFFNLGGHSILAVRLMSHIKREFGHDLALSTLFQHSTVAELAGVLRQRIPQASANWSTLVPIQPLGTKIPFFCIHPLGGSVFHYMDLARYIGTDQPFYGVQLPNLEGNYEAFSTLESMASQYVIAIQQVQPQGPYQLGGWSVGGLIAFEMARQLQEQGHEVAVLALIDSNIPSRSQMPVEEEPGIDDAALAKSLVQYYRIDVPQPDFYARDPEEQLLFIYEHLKRQNIAPVDLSLGQFRYIARSHKVIISAMYKYVPQIYSGRAILFKTTEGGEQAQSASPVSSSQDENKARGWEKLAAKGVEVLVLPGRHDTVVEEPHVKVLAESLAQHLIG